MHTGHGARRGSVLNRLKKSDKIRFANIDETPTRDAIMRGMGRVVYISYSRKDFSCYDSLQNLKSWLEANKFRVRMDKTETQLGDSIDSFMSKIGSANRIVLALSENYFKSLYCMTELYRIWQHSENDYERMRSRIAPFFLEPSCFSGRTGFLNTITKYWEQQHQVSDEEARELGAPRIHEKYMIDEIKGWIGQALHFLLDIVMHAPEDTSHDALYHSIGKMLMQAPVKK